VEAGYAGQLPPQFTRFFGRAEEIARLEGLLLDEQARLVTLTGPGGSGKTRLALEVARQVLEPFRGAVWFVPLADLADSRLIVDAVGEALSIQQVPGVERLEQVVEVLSRQPTLLVLDNFEHLLREEEGERGEREDGRGRKRTEENTTSPPHHLTTSPTALVRTLLSRVPTLACLVTSRQRLELAGEREYRVRPLPTPEGVTTLAEVVRCESVRLLVDRAQAARPDFQVTARNVSAVAALCDGLEGIPLALELAAARAQVLTPAQMVAQLEQRFDFLVSRRRDVAARHRTLRAAMEWSYQLLPLELQRFFARLSVFRGGWTLEAAAAVCCGGDEGLEMRD
jgi:predicted ATPase